MRALQAVGGGFALDRYGLRSGSPFVEAATDLAAGHEPLPLLLAADPVDLVPGAAEIAEDVLHGMSVYLRHTMNGDVRSALITAFRTANERVYSENRHRNGMRRIYLGLSCVALHGDELFVAQAAPSQILVWQDGHLHAIPSLNTWLAEQVTETFSNLSYPIGFHTTIEPQVSYSRCQPGDIVAVVSWPIARYLSRVPGIEHIAGAQELLGIIDSCGLADSKRALHGAVFEFGAASRAEPVSQAASTTARQFEYSPRLPLDDSVWAGDSRSINRSERHGTGYVRVARRRIAPIKSPGYGSGDTHGFDTLGADTTILYGTDSTPQIYNHAQSAADDFYHYELPGRPARFTTSEATKHRSEGHGFNNNYRYQPTERRRARTVAPTARKGNVVEIFAGLLLSLTAAVVGVWQVTKKDRPIHGPRDDGTLGLPHLQRWSDTYRAPRFERIRRAMPRLQVSGLVKLVTILTVLVVVGGLIYTQIVNRNDRTIADMEDRLQDIAALRMQAATTTNNKSAYETLVGAQAALAEMAATATTDDLQGLIADEQAAVNEALASISALEQITSVQVMGTVPAAADGVIPRLFQGNGRVYVFSDNLYELDQTTGSLIQLLAVGDEVGGSAVGPLLGATWNDDRPVAFDAQNAFMLDPLTGVWHRVPLGTIAPEGYSALAAVAMFNRSIYFLAPESGQILKFDALDFSAAPVDWTAGVAREELQRAVDLVVDGSIHVALEDGTVLSFFRSAHETTIQPPVTPPLEEVSALISAGEGSYFYLLDQADGRIVAIDKEGAVLRQYEPAPGAPSLAGATDLVINETNGIAHVIAGDTLYAVRLTLPERPSTEP